MLLHELVPHLKFMCFFCERITNKFDYESFRTIYTLRDQNLWSQEAQQGVFVNIDQKLRKIKKYVTKRFFWKKHAGRRGKERSNYSFIG